MKKHSEIEETLSLPENLPTIGAAIGALLTLVAIAGAVIVAAVYPTLDGHVIAVATGMGIGVIARAVTMATAILCRLRLPSDNDAWVYW